MKEFIIFVIIMTIIAVIIFQPVTTVKFETIQGDVVKTKYIEDKDYLEVTFDNGKTYNLKCTDDYVDLTDDSTLILKLHYMSWFLMPNTDNVWDIWEIIKVPEEI